MKPSETILAALGSPADITGVKPTLKVVALYNGFITSIYAHEAVGSLTMAVRPFMDVESSVWSFDMLARLDMRHLSIRTAAEADVIIFAADASAPLPVHVKSWLMQSLRENGRGTPILVALHEEDPERTACIAPLRADLEPIARQRNTPLLCNGEFDSRLKNGLTTELARRKECEFPERDPRCRPSAHLAGRWGINE